MPVAAGTSRNASTSLRGIIFDFGGVLWDMRWDVARELRRNPSTAQTRLIAITGYGRDEDRRRAQEVGFDYLLAKPADPETLLRLIGAN